MRNAILKYSGRDLEQTCRMLLVLLWDTSLLKRAGRKGCRGENKSGESESAKLIIAKVCPLNYIYNAEILSLNIQVRNGLRFA